MPIEINGVPATTAQQIELRAGLGLGAAINHIGVPGQIGFGVGICPATPAAFSGMPGYLDPASPNYGNYLHLADGSVMCWVPAFYYRLDHASNPTYATHALNSADVQPLAAFADVAAANAAGYALHRAFYNASTTQQGVFVDKYLCSNNAGTASSLRMGNPLSTAADHNPIAALAGAPANNHGGALAAAKTRGSRFFCATRFVHAMLALLAMAHGQAAANTTACAWWQTTGDVYPRGCNNNALGDSDDTSVKWQGDGYGTCGKTGSGSPFAKTTHNGQACGIADLNGTMWEVSWGVTCITTSVNVTGVALTNPLQITVPAHGGSTGKEVQLQSLGGATQLNDKMYRYTVVDANTISLDGVNGTTGISAWTSGGAARFGTFYALRTTADVAALTGGNTLATDAWGITGITAHSDAIAPFWRTDYPNNGFGQLMGNAASQVLSPAVSGAGWLLAGNGMLGNDLGSSPAGANVFGRDYYYQHLASEQCPLAGADWNDGSAAGVWASHWPNARGVSSVSAGLRAASYL